MIVEEVFEIVKELVGEENPVVTPLGGGVSCLVALVTTSKGRWVVKKARKRLSVEAEWIADLSRVFREVSCLKVIREYVDVNAAPAILLEDRKNYAFVMEYGENGVTWKQLLMKNVVDPSTTLRVATILSKLHSKTREVKSLEEEFGDNTNFYQLRLEPYIIFTSNRHVDIRDKLNEIAELLVSRKLCVVHGDYSPKNILLLPDGRIWALDCEPAHYGNPVFDVAFCINHLILKTIHLNSQAHLAEAKRFWKTYWSGLKWDEDDVLQREAVRVLGALMLARVDGKSPVEYLSEENRAKVRNLARKFISDKVDEFESIVSTVSEVLS